MADLTSGVIKIRLKNWFLSSSLSRLLKVIGTDRDRSAIYDFLLVFYSNYVPKAHRFWDIRLQKCCDLEIRVRGPSRSLDMSPFDRAHAIFYWRFIVIWLSRVVSDIFNIEKCRDLEIRVLVYCCRICDVDHLKEWLIEEWRYFDHGIIDRAVNQVNQWQKRLWRCISENGGHFQHQV